MEPAAFCEPTQYQLHSMVPHLVIDLFHFAGVQPWQQGVVDISSAQWKDLKHFSCPTKIGLHKEKKSSDFKILLTAWLLQIFIKKVQTKLILKDDNKNKNKIFLPPLPQTPDEDQLFGKTKTPQEVHATITIKLHQVTGTHHQDLSKWPRGPSAGIRFLLIVCLSKRFHGKK